MSTITDIVSLGRLGLSVGEGRRFDFDVVLDPLTYAGERYEPRPPQVPVRLDVSRTLGGGYALRLRFAAALCGPCMRCLELASPLIEVDAREISLAGGGVEEESPYVEAEQLALRSWAHDAFALAAPEQVLCDPQCEGLCAICAVRLATAPGHQHDPPPDSRWAALRELKLD